ncbi:MAG: hypothetical protein ACLUEV_02740 [Alistipes sp.]
MTPLKNFFHVLKKYKIASLLNVIGLSIAFASFMIIMTQVNTICRSTGITKMRIGYSGSKIRQ